MTSNIRGQDIAASNSVLRLQQSKNNDLPRSNSRCPLGTCNSRRRKCPCFCSQRGGKIENARKIGGDRKDAEDAIRSAFFVLNYIEHGAEQRFLVAQAIGLYDDDRFREAAVAALALANGRITRSSVKQSAAPTSLSELKTLFEAARLRKLHSAHPMTAASQSPSAQV